MSIPDSLVMWPVRFSATSYVLRVTAGGVTSNLAFPASGSLSTTQDYYMTGDGQSDDLITMLAETVQSHANVATCGGSVTAGFRVELNADVAFTLHWSHANTTLDGLIFGWTGSDTASADPQTSPNMPQCWWRPGRPIAVDSRDRQPVIGGVAQSIAGDVRISSFGTPYKERDISFIYVTQNKILSEYAESDEPYNVFEYAWVNSIALGRIIRIYDDEGSISGGSSTYSSYRVRNLADPMRRNQAYEVFWDVVLRLARTSA